MIVQLLSCHHDLSGSVFFTLFFFFTIFPHLCSHISQSRYFFSLFDYSEPSMCLVVLEVFLMNEAYLQLEDKFT